MARVEDTYTTTGNGTATQGTAGVVLISGTFVGGVVIEVAEDDDVLEWVQDGNEITSPKAVAIEFPSNVPLKIRTRCSSFTSGSIKAVVLTR